MSLARVMVGNSSSALIEAPCFKLPAVNVGSRQRGRMRGNNVIDVACDRHAIRNAVERALSPEFRRLLEQECRNPYLGDGQVAQRIVRILKTVAIDDALLTKAISY
jgi:UDP-N-acetylglucosamine 2-epimerase